MRLTLVLLGTLFFSMSAFGEGGELIGDYNVGGAVVLGELNEDKNAAVGVVGNVEVVAMGDLNQKHLVVIDGRAVSFMGGGYEVPALGDDTILFALRMTGNVSFGLQAFQVLPLNLSFEDIELRVHGSDVQSHALIGTTFYLPVSVWSNMEGANLYLAVTAGARVNSMASHSAFALQPKLRYIDDKISLEARYLQTLNDDIDEKRGVVQASMNHVLKAGDQLGFILTKGTFQDTGAEKEFRVTEGLFFYGGNL